MRSWFIDTFMWRKIKTEMFNNETGVTLFITYYHRPWEDEPKIEIPGYKHYPRCGFPF